jgi:hypothetical protein
MVQPAAEAVGLAFKEPAWREVAVTDGIAGVLRPLDINVADLIGPPLTDEGDDVRHYRKIFECGLAAQKQSPFGSPGMDWLEAERQLKREHQY